MSGGLIQLVTIGAHDRYLTSEPSITYWKSVYRRHTNHAIESVRQTFVGEPRFGSKTSVTLGRNGDLVSDLYLEVELPPMPNGTVTTGYNATAWTNGTPTPAPGFYAHKHGSYTAAGAGDIGLFSEVQAAAPGGSGANVANPERSALSADGNYYATVAPQSTGPAGDPGVVSVFKKSPDNAWSEMVKASKGTLGLTRPVGGISLDSTGSTLAVVDLVDETRTGFAELQNVVPDKDFGTAPGTHTVASVRTSQDSINVNRPLYAINGDLSADGLFAYVYWEVTVDAVSSAGMLHVFRKVAGTWSQVQIFRGTSTDQRMGSFPSSSDDGKYLIFNDANVQRMYEWNGSQYIWKQDMNTAVNWGNANQSGLRGPDANGDYFAVVPQFTTTTTPFSVFQVNTGTGVWTSVFDYTDPSLTTTYTQALRFSDTTGAHISWAFERIVSPGGYGTDFRVLDRQSNGSYVIFGSPIDTAWESNDHYIADNFDITPDGQFVAIGFGENNAKLDYGYDYLDFEHTPLIVYRRSATGYEVFQTYTGPGGAVRQFNSYADARISFSADGLTLMVSSSRFDQYGRVEILKRATVNDQFDAYQYANPTDMGPLITSGNYGLVSEMTRDASTLMAVNSAVGGAVYFYSGGNSFSQTTNHVRIWSRSGSTWSLADSWKLPVSLHVTMGVPSDTGPLPNQQPIHHNENVVLSSDATMLMIGVPLEGIIFEPNDTSIVTEGTVLSYRKIGGAWTLVQKLRDPAYASNGFTISMHRFGSSLALSENQASFAVGAPSGNFLNGEVFVYGPSGNDWVLVRRSYGPGDSTLYGMLLSFSADGAELAVLERGNMRNAGLDHAYTVYIVHGFTFNSRFLVQPVAGLSRFADGGMTLGSDGLSILISSATNGYTRLYTGTLGTNYTQNKEYQIPTNWANAVEPGRYFQTLATTDLATVAVGDPAAYSGAGATYFASPSIGEIEFTGASPGDEYFAYVSYVNEVGLALLKSVEIEIGGQTIDKNYGEFMAMWNELALSSDKEAGYRRMIGKYSRETEAATQTFQGSQAPATWSAHSLNRLGGRYFIPLRFWFCGTPGSALPIVALQYHEVKIHFEFRPLNELLRFDPGSDVDVSNPVDGWDIYHAGASAENVPGSIDTTSHVKLSAVELWADYVFLDHEERKRFASTDHEYLISQLQFLLEDSVPSGITSHRVNLSLNHPVKAIYWVILRSDTSSVNPDTGNQWFDFGHATKNTDVDRLRSATILLNGHERFATRTGSYFRLVQPYQCHSRVPDKQVYVYSFALDAEGHQPSGSCNFSRVDNASLNLEINGSALGGTTAIVKTYGVNYNVLRVQSGMAGVRFGN